MLPEQLHSYHFHFRDEGQQGFLAFLLKDIFLDQKENILFQLLESLGKWGAVKSNSKVSLLLNLVFKNQLLVSDQNIVTKM